MVMTFQVGDTLPRLEHAVSRLQLFRHSAVTWNPHRIHFDESYALAEGHDGLAVHSHFRAALALRCVTEGLGPGWHVERFSYRLRKPVFAPADLVYTARVTAADDETLTLTLLEEHLSGELGFEGTVRVSRIRDKTTAALAGAAAGSTS